MRCAGTPALLLVISIPLLGPTHIMAVRVWNTLDGSRPDLYAHRGESTLAPANTLLAFELAAILQADFIEPDLHLTKDEVLVCHHDFGLKESTHHSEELEHLRGSFVDALGTLGQVEYVDDWFIKDFTAAQLKTLRVKQEPVGIRPRALNGLLEIPTFAEFLELVHNMTVKLKQRQGIIPELKFPKYYNSMEGRHEHYMEDQFLSTMAEFGCPTKSDSESNFGWVTKHSAPLECPRVRVQCFEMESLAYLRTQSDFDTILIVNGTIEDIKHVAGHGFNELAIWKGASIESLVTSNMVSWCHQNGLRLSVYTIKDSRENESVGNTSKEDEMKWFMDLGVDAMFVENIAESREIRTKYECATHINDTTALNKL